MNVLWRLVSVIVRPSQRGWFIALRSNWGTIPHPEDDPTVMVAGPDADHILLIGDGPVIGFGVASHDLALPGQVARQVAGITGRGAIVQCISDEGLMVHNIEQRYLDNRTEHHDAIVVFLGISDATRFTSPRVWRSHLRHFIRAVNSDERGIVRIVLVAIAPISTMPMLTGLPARLTQRQADSLNLELEAVAGEFANVTFLPFLPPREPDPQRYRSAQTYRAWAALISPTVATLLGHGIAAVRQLARNPVQESGRIA
jgi:lysophospholipase L1-like esterase